MLKRIFIKKNKSKNFFYVYGFSRNSSWYLCMLPLYVDTRTSPGTRIQYCRLFIDYYNTSLHVFPI